MSLLPKLIQLKTPLKKLLKIVTYESGALKDGDGNTLSTSGETNTASNVNTAGVGVFKQKSVADLQFKGINAGSTKISVTDDTATNEIDIDVVEANLTLSSMGGSIDLSGAKASGVLAAARFPALTGNVTTVEGSLTTTIANNSITAGMIPVNTIGNPRLVDMAANTVKCNNTNATADPADMAMATSTILGRGPTGNIAALTLTGGLTISDTAVKSKGSFGFPFTFSTTTAETDPGAGTVRFNNATLASVTEIFLSPTDAHGRNIGPYISTWAANGILGYISNNSSSTVYGAFTIGSIVNNAGAFYSIVATPLASVGTLPANGDELIITFFAKDAGLTTQDVLDMDVVRLDVNGQLIDNTGAVVSGSAEVADYTALLALSAATYENFVVIVDSGLNRSGWLSNGSSFTPFQGQYVQESQNIPGNAYVVGTAGITWTASDNGSGKVKLTSNVAHGITEAAGEGSYLYLISGGTGWTAGSSHQIDATNGFISTTELLLTTNYTASMGVPVFALAGTTEATCAIKLKSITLPALRANTEAILEYGIEYSSSTDSKHGMIYLESTQLGKHNTTAANLHVPYRMGFRNQNNTSSQRSLNGANGNGFTGSTSAQTTAAVATGTTGTVLSIQVMMGTASQTAKLAEYDLLIRR